MKAARPYLTRLQYYKNMATGALIYSDESLIIANSLGDATVYIEYEPYGFSCYDSNGDEISSGTGLIVGPSWKDINFVPDWYINTAEITLPLTTLKSSNSFTLDLTAIASGFITATDALRQQFPDINVKIIVQQKGVVGTFSTQKKGLKLYIPTEVYESSATPVRVVISAVNGRITGVF